MNTLRLGTTSDIETVARIWHEGWRDGHLGHVPAALAAHRDAAQFRQRVVRRITHTWVAEDPGDGAVLGFFMLDGSELEQIYVDRAARGSGVAGALLRHAQTLLRQAGHRVVWLAVVAGNARARAFYARQGWRDAGPMDYEAETEVGTFTVPTHRYEIDLA